MNQYGRRAQRHWQELPPRNVAGLKSLECLATHLEAGVQHELRLRWTSERVREPVVAGESYLERVGRPQRQRHEVEGEVLRELVLLSAKDHVYQAADPDLSRTDFTVAERARGRVDTPPRLLELAGLSGEALGRQGLV